MSTSALATSAARKSRSTGGVRFPVLGAAAGNVGGTDVHADRSTQNAAVLSMTACRMAGKFRTPEKKWGAQWRAKFYVWPLPSGGWDHPRQHTLYVWGVLISIRIARRKASTRQERLSTHGFPCP